MGSGTWSACDFKTYSTTCGYSITSTGSRDLSGLNASQVYKQISLDEGLNPLNKVRECKDSEEHPNTIPVILALDCTGSMGDAAVEVAAELSVIIKKLYEEVADVEFLIMGIGDFTYDRAPLQVSQFESDIRIIEQLDKLWFEFGGGPNSWESYTAAWCFAAQQTELDCWKRGKKGIIITMGDEEINPHIDAFPYKNLVNNNLQTDKLDTDQIYEWVKDKYDLYHIDVDHSEYRHPDLSGFKKYCGEKNVFRVPVNGIAQVITDIVLSHETNPVDEDGNIVW